MLWILGLMWALKSKGFIASSSLDTNTLASATESNDEQPTKVERPAVPVPDPDAELIVPPASESEHILRFEGDRPAAPNGPVTEATVQTYPVWFESERKIGVCRITWEGGSKTANLHVATRLPGGKLEFSYQCGKHRGRSSIEVKPKRVNGVLFCEDKGGVKVKTVRSKDGRCGR